MVDLEKYIGKPFENGGRGPDTYDCWGLVMAVLREYGIVAPDYRIDCFDCLKIADQINESARSDWLEIKTPEAPCVVVMRMHPDHPQLCTHTGLYIGHGKFIHALRKVHSSMASITNPLWKNKIEGYYKWNSPSSR